jgi:hypothetical protein
MRTLIFLSIVSLLCNACCDEDHGQPTEEFMVFGHFYGECLGEGCVEMYKIENGQLYEDQLDQYPNSTGPYVGEWIAFLDHTYDEVSDIIDKMPAELYNESDRVLGQPDAGDWGGIYVQTYDPATGANRFWLLDKMESNMPEVYNAFVDEIETKIQLINQ